LQSFLLFSCIPFVFSLKQGENSLFNATDFLKTGVPFTVKILFNDFGGVAFRTLNQRFLPSGGYAKSHQKLVVV
jgi:hypothetical protein